MDDGAPPSAYATRPDSLKKLRACLGCKLIKTETQFLLAACDNCPQPERRGKDYLVEWTERNTTADFEGCVLRRWRAGAARARSAAYCCPSLPLARSLVSMMQPNASWVARWLRMRMLTDEGQVSFKPGVYAIALPGEAAKLAAEDGRGAAGSDDEYEEEEEEEEEEGDGGEEEAEAAASGAGAAADDDGDESSSGSSGGSSSGSGSGSSSSSDEAGLDLASAPPPPTAAAASSAAGEPAPDG